MVEQNALDALEIADRGYLLVDGSNAREGRRARVGRGCGGATRIPWRLIAAIIVRTTKRGKSCRNVLFITRRAALLTGAGAIAAPFVVTTPGFGQTGPIKHRGSRIAHRLRVAVRTEQPARASGGGRSGERRGRPARAQARILAEDDQTNAEAGVRAARKLIDVDKVQAIMSVWASAVGTAVLPLCWENKVMLLGISAADSIALLPHQGYFVRTQPHTELQGKEFGRFILAQGGKNVYLMMPQTPFTETVFKAIRETVEPKGVKVGSVIIDGKKTSFRSEIDEMMRANPDMFMMGGYLAENIVMAKDVFRANLQGQGHRLRLRHHAGIHRRRRQGSGRRHLCLRRALAGRRLLGLCEAQGAGEEGHARYLHLPGLRPRQSCDPRRWRKGKDATGTGIRDNIRKIANNDDAMKVDNALDGLKAIADGKEIKYSGASGPCKFSDIGNIIEVAFRTTQVKDGKLVEVKS